MSVQQRVIVVAPTIEQGRKVARDFGIPIANVCSTPASMRGLSSKVVLMYNQYGFLPQKLDQIRMCIEASNHLVINIPEYILR